MLDDRSFYRIPRIPADIPIRGCGNSSAASDQSWRESPAEVFSAPVSLYTERGQLSRSDGRDPLFTREWHFMPLSEKLRMLVKSAWDDGFPCLLATQSGVVHRGYKQAFGAIQAGHRCNRPTP